MYFFYFYPVGMDQPLRRTPVMTYCLIAVMSVLFLWARYFPFALSTHPSTLVFFPGNGAPYSVVTAAFLHAGWLHFLGNLVYFWVFAPLLEDRLGSVRFLFYWVMLGAFGNMAHGLVSVFGLMGQVGMGVMGASGAIAGMLAMMLVRFYYAQVSIAYWVFSPLQGVNKAGRAYLPLPVAGGLWLLLQVAQSLLASETGAGVSYGAHLGGFGLGLFLALVLGYLYEARAEARLVQGRKYLHAGQALAAEGSFLEYLEMKPDDLEVTLMLARSRKMDGRSGRARNDYLLVLRQYLKQGRIDDAIDLFHEIRRDDSMPDLPPEELSQVAFFLEKTLDYAAAVEVYLDLYRLYPDFERSENALVRAIMLTKDKLGDKPAARAALELAWRKLRPGVWRDFLQQEFNLGKGPNAQQGPTPLPEDPEPVL